MEFEFNNTISNKFNSFHKKEAEPVSPRLSSSSVGEIPPAVQPNPTNAAKEIMNHHESRSRLIRDSSCDSIQDEVFNNRNGHKQILGLFLGEQIVPRILRVTDHLERYFMAC